MWTETAGTRDGCVFPRWRRWRTRRTRASTPGICSTTRVTNWPSSTAPGWTPATKPPGPGELGDLLRLSGSTRHGEPRRTGVAGRAIALRIRRPRSLVRHLLVAGRSGVGGAGQGTAVLYRAAR